VRGQNFTESWFRRIFAYSVWIVSKNNPDFFACHARMLPKSLPVRIAQKRQKLILAYAITNKQEYDRIKHIADNEFFDNKPFIK
jgi:hypothetical protein